MNENKFNTLSHLRLLAILITATTIFGAKAEVFFENFFCFKAISSTEVEVSNASDPPSHMDYVYNPNDPLNDVLNIQYRHNLQNVVVPEKITHDGKEYTVARIGMNAFDGCYLMESISLPPTIRSIGDNAFTLCTALTSIDIPETVTSIGGGAFRYCQELTDIVVPGNCQSIGARAFSDCLKLERITIGGSVQSIGDYAFASCSKIKQVIFADGTETLELGIRATDNKIINGITKPIVGLFWDTSTVDYVYLGRDLNYITSNSDYRPFYMVNEAEIGPMVKHIHDNMFATLTAIVSIPEGVETIGNSAFSGAKPKTGVFKLPSTLKSIGSSAFQDQIVFECAAVTPPACVKNSSFGGAGLKRMFVPDGSGELYRADPNWQYVTIIDEADEVVKINVKNPGTLLSRLSAKGFSDLNTVYSLKLSGTLDEDDIANISSMYRLHYIDLSEIDMDTIPVEMFKNTAVSRAVFPSNLKAIGASAFNNRCFRGDLVIPNTCTYVGSGAFSDALIESLAIESDNCEIRGFSGCKMLQELNLEGENIIVGDYAFWNCNFASVTLGKGISVMNRAFNNCSMSELNLLEGLKSIGQEAFANTDVREVAIPSTVESIGTLAFYNSKLQHVTFNEDCKAILGGQVFYYCNDLEDVVLPKNIDCIPDSTFYYCKSLRNVNMPEGITSIGSYAFTYCNIEDINLPESLEYIGYRAFYYSGFKNVKVLWPEPIDIADEVFVSKTSPRCLYCPVGTSTLYRKTKGWNGFNQYKESAVLTVNLAGAEYGSVYVDGTKISGSIDAQELEPYDSLTITFEPDDGCVINYLCINGSEEINRGNYTGSNLDGNEFYVDEVEGDYEITIAFVKYEDVPIYLYDGNKEKITVVGLDNATDMATSPNALFFVENCSEMQPNFIKNNKANNITLVDEDEFYSPCNVFVENLNYSRTFNNTNWQAFYIPFNLSYSEWESYVDIAEVSNVRGYDEDGDGIIDRTVLEFNKVNSGDLRPNTPYVVRAKNKGIVDFVCENKTLFATPDQEGSVKCSSTRYNYWMKGVYQLKDDMYQTGAYALSGGLFCPASGASVVLKPFRFYLVVEPKQGGYQTNSIMKLPPRIEIVVDGESSGVYDVNDDAVQDLYFDLSGRRLDVPKPGIVIKNGVKQLIR